MHFLVPAFAKRGLRFAIQWHARIMSLYSGFDPRPVGLVSPDEGHSRLTDAGLSVLAARFRQPHTIRSAHAHWKGACTPTVCPMPFAAGREDCRAARGPRPLLRRQGEK